jgi:hypothetical protein
MQKYSGGLRPSNRFVSKADKILTKGAQTLPKETTGASRVYFQPIFSSPYVLLFCGTAPNPHPIRNGPQLAGFQTPLVAETLVVFPDATRGLPASGEATLITIDLSYAVYCPGPVAVVAGATIAGVAEFSVFNGP